MCQSVSGITFCSCVGKLPKQQHISRKQKKEAKNPEVVIWSLFELVGHAKHTMDGLLMMPDDSLGGAFTSENIIRELNARNCFDFDYVPKENDCIRISRQNSGGFMSFLFENGQWCEGMHNTFLFEIEKFNYGKINFE